MLWNAELVSELTLKVQDIVAFFEKLLAAIFGFIGKNEGWEETTAAE